MMVAALLLALTTGAAVAISAVAYLRASMAFGTAATIAVAPLAALMAIAFAALTLRVLEVRSRPAALISFLAVGATGYAAGWALRLSPAAALSGDPGALEQAFRSLVPQLGEIGLVLAGECLALLTVAVLASRPFDGILCAWCGTGCGVEPDVSRLALDDPREAHARISSRDWDYFLRLGAPRAEDKSWLRFDLSSCECGLTRTAGLFRARRFSKHRIVDKLRMTPDEVRTIRGLDRNNADVWCADVLSRPHTFG